jgi:uncharacterized protein (TIGR02118 family)
VIKRISLARRRPDLSREEFAAHWLGPHAEIARGIPKIRGYIINLVDDPDRVGWDGIAETWFDNHEDAVNGFESEPIVSQLRDDRPKFLHEVVVFFVDVHEVVPLAASTADGEIA